MQFKIPWMESSPTKIICWVCFIVGFAINSLIFTGGFELWKYNEWSISMGKVKAVMRFGATNFIPIIFQTIHDQHHGNNYSYILCQSHNINNNGPSG